MFRVFTQQWYIGTWLEVCAPGRDNDEISLTAAREAGTWERNQLLCNAIRLHESQAWSWSLVVWESVSVCTRAHALHTLRLLCVVMLRGCYDLFHFRRRSSIAFQVLLRGRKGLQSSPLNAGDTVVLE